MQSIVRTILTATLAVFLSTMMGEIANAEPLNATQWGFSATFGCQSQLSSQITPSPIGNLVITSYSCDSGDNSFVVAIVDYPVGTMAPDKIDNAYAGAIDGAAKSAQGTIRSVAPYSLGTLAGRDALMDIADSKQTLHMRLFIKGDRLYQTLCVVSTGDEQAKACLDFLNSFALTGSP